MMRDRKREVVVTGAGLCCHMGDDLPAILGMIRQGINVPFPPWEPAIRNHGRCRIVGVFNGDVSNEALGVSKQQGRFLGRAARLALSSTRQALAQSGREVRDLAVVVGSGTGDVQTHIEVRQRLDETHDAKRVSPTIIPKLMASTVSANLVNVLRTTGPSLSATAACAGGAYNILLAAQLIEAGFTEAALAGGVEAADVHFWAGFDAMRAYNSGDNDTPERASRPYAADRAGFIFSEGAGVLVLETRAAAEARGAPILGSIRGYGISSDGTGEMVAPSEDGAARAMQQALDHAEIRPEDIDYINTHGTSTPLGDISEVRAIRRVFAGRPVAYSSTKGYTGHTISGAGAIEAIFTLAMLREGWLAPSVNARPLDPELQDYPPVLEPERRKLRFALSNSFGFGGTNATLVLAEPSASS